MLVWCRDCSRFTRVQLRGKLLDHCQPFVDERKRKRMLKRIQNLEEGPVPEGKDWRTEGKKLPVTRKVFLKRMAQFHDSNFMAQRGVWQIMEQRIIDGRRGETNECQNVVRECQAIAEEDSWSGWNEVKEQIWEINQAD